MTRPTLEGRFADRFEIRAFAGSGGMGTVYRAFDEVTGREVALKRMHARAGDARFEREGRLLAALDHPAIVQLVAAGETEDGERYLAMEWLEGQTLFDRLRGEGLTVAQAVALARRLAAGLAAAHAQGVVHRDVKPSNVLLVGGAPEDARLLDFGVAHARLEAPLTEGGVPLGTPGYMAPEQVRGLAGIDARADVFALGCVLYECLVGGPPFVGRDPFAVLSKILLEGIPRVANRRPAVGERLDALVAAMMARDAADRPADGRAVAEQLAALPEATGQAPTRVSGLPTALSGAERHLVSVVLAAPPGADAAAVSDATLAPSDTLGAEEHGVQAFRMLGGAYVAAITEGGSATDLAARGADHALRLRARLPDAAIVLCTGPGVLDGQLASGEVLDRAGELLRDANAQDGAIRLDLATAGLLGARYPTRRDATDGGDWLIGPAPLRGGVRWLLGRPTPFVGRRRELAALEAAFAACEEEPCAVPVVVLGEPGIGKSRLRYELEARIAGRARLLRAAEDPTHVGAPLGTIAALLRDAVGDATGEALAAALGAGLDDARRAQAVPFLRSLLGAAADDDDPRLRAARADASIMREQLRRAFEDWLLAQCEAGPVALLLDDLQWSDPASVSFLDSALRAAGELPLFVLACARPELRERFAGLWSARGVQEITLGQLGRRAAERLARSVLDEASADLAGIVERGAGHPLYLEELIRASAEGAGDGGSATVLAMIHARLDRLDAPQRRALQAASVFGDTFWRAGVAHLLGGRVPEDELSRALEDLASRELVVPSAPPRFAGQAQFVFRHDLIREAASEMLAPDDRVIGHRLAAEWLRSAGETRPLVLARHLEAGDRPGEAGPRYREAAERAVERSDLEGALAHVARAEACFERAGEASARDLERLHLAAAHAHNARGEFAKGVPSARAAMEVASVGDLGWWQAAGELAEALGRLGELDSLTAVVDALDAAPVGPGAQRACAVALSRAHYGLRFIGQHAIARRLRPRLDAQIDALADEPLAIAWRAAVDAYEALLVGRMDDYLEQTRIAGERLGECGDLRGQVRQLSNQGAALTLSGRHDEAERVFERASADAARLGMTYTVAHSTMSRGFIQLQRGAPARAHALFEEALGLFERGGDLRSIAYTRTFLGLATMERGATAEAVQIVRRSLREAASHPHMRTHARAALAQALLAHGEPAEALVEAEAAYAERAALGRLEISDARIDVALADALLATGQPERAAAVFAEGRRRLEEVTARWDDASLRASYLEGVATHRRIVEATSG